MFMRLSLLTVILGAALCAGAYGQAKPDFSGNWKLNVKKSDFGSDPAPDSVVAKVEHKNNVFKYTASGTGGGQDFQEEAEVAIDGKEHPGPNGYPGTMTVKWDGQMLAFEMKMDDGTVVQQGTFKLSADGKVITREVHGKSQDGTENKRVEIYDKQ